MRGRNFACDEAPAGEGEQTADQRGTAVGEREQAKAQTGIALCRESGTERRQVSVAFRRHRAEHGQHQAEMLDHDGSVLDAPAEQRAKCDLDYRDRHHQRERRGGHNLVEAPEANQARKSGNHQANCPWRRDRP